MKDNIKCYINGILMFLGVAYNTILWIVSYVMFYIRTIKYDTIVTV